MEATAGENDILGGQLSPNEASGSIKALTEMRRFGVIPHCGKGDSKFVGGLNTRITFNNSNWHFNKISINESANYRICRALDCGAGYGRVTKNVLLKVFNRVDIADSAENLLAAARENIGTDFWRVEKSYRTRFQDFFA